MAGPPQDPTGLPWAASGPPTDPEGRRRPRRRRLLLLLVALVVGVVAAVAPAGPGARRAAGRAGGPEEGDRVVYAPPVDAPVTDPFRPPPEPWLPGNRGIEYATTPGTAVRAAGRGRVSFAGRIGAELYVTVSHPDGVRTSYSYLASIGVVAGAEVVRGQVLGTAGARLHVGARRGATYIDPASLWGAGGPPWVRLAPLDGADQGGGASRGPPSRRVGGVRGVAT